jgi:hypothetical protein
MFNKIAVVLRGHIRTWHYINKYVFESYANIAKSVDYYVVTWYFPNLDTDKLIDSFRGQNLKKIITVVPEQYYNGGMGPSYLASHVLEPIMAGDYDAVIDTRPDIFPLLKTEFKPEMAEKAVYTVWDNKPAEVGDDPGIDDTFQVMTKNTFEIYCKKYLQEYHPQWHVDLKKYYNFKNNIKTYGISDGYGLNLPGWWGWYIVRPNMIESFPEDGNFYSNQSLGKILWDKWWEWNCIPYNERISFLSRYNIILPDYINNLIIESYHFLSPNRI